MLQVKLSREPFSFITRPTGDTNTWGRDGTEKGTMQGPAKGSGATEHSGGVSVN